MNIRSLHLQGETVADAAHRSPSSRRNSVRLGRAGLVVGIALGVTIGSVLDLSRKERHEAELEQKAQELGAAVAADGFDLANMEDMTYGKAFKRIALNLGSCTISNVSYVKQEDKEGHLSDVLSYRFKAVREGTEQQVSLSFESRTDLEEALGPDPCFALA